jgi:probable phosphoglycerate mutase
MTTIFIARHGQYANPDLIAPYRLPGFHLTPKGIADVSLVAEKLKGERISAIFTSPLERTRETAEILAKPFGITPIADTRLLEVRSPLEGKTIAQIEALGGWNWSVYDAPWYTLEKGETLDEIFKRVNDIVEEKRKEYKNTSVILVTHGDPVMLMAAHYMGIPRNTGALAGIQPYVPMGGGYRLEFATPMKNSPVVVKPIV